MFRVDAGWFAKPRIFLPGHAQSYRGRQQRFLLRRLRFRQGVRSDRQQKSGLQTSPCVASVRPSIGLQSQLLQTLRETLIRQRLAAYLEYEKSRLRYQTANRRAGQLLLRLELQHIGKDC